MGGDGWLGIGWPKEYGGQGRGVLDQFIFFDEVQRAGAPFPFVTINTVGPTLMTYGSDEQKRDYLPGILNGDVNFAIGYTEPEAGTDLASLRTRAVLDGDEWVINGNKVFTSGANQADYIWLACRTDPDAPKHKGISMIIVPTVVAGVQDDADRDGRQRRHPGHLLRRRACAERQRRRRGQRRVAAHHQPAQPRARRARRARGAHAPPLRRRVEAGAGRHPRVPPSRTARDDRRAVGAAASSRRAHAQARGDEAAELADGVRGRRRHAHARPTRRR